MSGRQQRQNAVAPQLTGLWVPLSATESLLNGLKRDGLSSVMAISPATLQHMARITTSFGAEPWDSSNTVVLYEYLTGVFIKALQHRFVLSFHGRVFAKPQMSAINVDARDADGRTPVGQGVPFANVNFSSRNGSNVVEVTTEAGIVTITSRSKALLFASGLLDASGEPVYCLAVPAGKAAAGRTSAKQQWQFCWTLNAAELSDKLSPPLNNGKAHSRSNVKHRLEPLPIKWQPPTASFLRDAPASMLALDPRQPIEYNISLQDSESFSALPQSWQQIPPTKLPSIVQQGKLTRIFVALHVSSRLSPRHKVCTLVPLLQWSMQAQLLCSTIFVMQRARSIPSSAITV